MQCPACKFDNPAGVKFCGQCGARLESVCPACRAANPPGNKFCHECGRSLVAGPPVEQFASPRTYTPAHLAQKILTSRSAVEGERKQVTVLFVDVSGFTSLSERLDPEEVHRLMTRVFQLVLAEVHRVEGTVNQFLGDGVMALFGAPIAHEDHAWRAVHAALGIRKALEALQEELRPRGISFRVRQGLNTGLVVVGSIGSDLRMDYTAVGDTTNVAARLEQAADPGRILVSAATHRLVEGFFHTRPLGPLTLKGKAEPIPAWEVVGGRAARTRLEVEAERGLTPLVGRERELRALAESFEKARSGHGQVVFIVGEPGIGKSRLLYEFRRRLGENATWLEGHCMSFGHAIAFHPVIDLLRRTFRIEDGDSEETISSKIERSVLRLGEDLRSILPAIRNLLSLDPGDPALQAMDPRERRGELFSGLRRLLARAAEVRPQIAVIEDIHWMDRATEEYLHFITDSLPTSRVLHVLTYRPGFAHPFGERTYHTRIGLDALSTEDSVHMAQAMLESEGLPEDLNLLVVRKAEGNPFFVEEVVKSLQELGALRRVGDRYVLGRRLEDIVIPDTIQDVIMARIDRLEDAPKKTLQMASVIGREFTRRLLDQLVELQDRTDDFLRELKSIELIYEKFLFPELAYMFKHALTHEVTYNSLLMQRRKELHRVVARAIEALYADRPAEQYEVLGHHFAKAEEWPKALEYLLKAAEKAAKSFAIRDALALYDQALEATAHLDEKTALAARIAIHRAKSNHFFAVGEFVSSRAESEQAVALARQAGDRMIEADAMAWTAFATQWAQDFDQALIFAQRAVELAEPIGARTAVARAQLTTGYIHALRGQMEQGREGLDRAIATSRAAGDHGVHSLSLQVAAFVRSWQGMYAEASGLTAEGLRIARQYNLLIPLTRALWAHALVLVAKGDYDPALALLQEGLAITEKIGDEGFSARYLNSIGWLQSECEDLDHALEASRAAVTRARNWRHAVGVEITAYCEINIGDIFMSKGDLAVAGEVLDVAHGIAFNSKTHDWMKWRYTCHLCISQGEYWVARGDPDKAKGFADQGLEIATRTNSRKYLVRGARLRGEIGRARRQWEEAETALRQAVSLGKEVGNPPQLWKAHLALGRLYQDMKKPDAARVAYRAGRAVVERMKQGLHDAQIRSSLESSPLVRELYDEC